MKSLSLSLTLNDAAIPQVSTHKHLGLHINELLSWSNHVHEVCSSASRRIGLLRRLRLRLGPLIIRQLYCSSIRPALEYAGIAWCGMSSTDSAHLEMVQRRVARLISNLPRTSNPDVPHNILLARAGLQPLEDRRRIELAVFAFRFVHGGGLPRHLLQGLAHWLSAKPQATARLRNAAQIRLPRPHKNVLKVSPLYMSFSVWNGLSNDARDCKSPRGLRSLLCRSL